MVGLASGNSAASVQKELPQIGRSHTGCRSHRRYFKENTCLVLPSITSFGSRNHQGAGENAESNAIDDVGNWVPSLTL